MRIRDILLEPAVQLNESNTDGRINSSIDEDTILKILDDTIPNLIKISKMRMWHDLCAFDETRNIWIPINIKTSTFKSSDNVGNLSICAYAYTNIEMDLNKNYNSSQVHEQLIDALKSKNYNNDVNRDYYFLVVNKLNPTEIIINSVRGLTKLTPNMSNLPFQVNWKYNRTFKIQPIEENIWQFTDCFKDKKIHWKEMFTGSMVLLTQKLELATVKSDDD